MEQKANLSPEHWMGHDASTVRDLPVNEKQESIRGWYARTTSKVRHGLVWATIVTCLFALVFYFVAPHSVHLSLQIFNGAVVIPAAAAIWIAAFVYIFLIPNREVGFRSQEAIEQTVGLLRTALEGTVAPAAAVWKRIGQRVEVELPRILQEHREALELLRASAAQIEKAVEKNEKFAEDAKPAIDALKRIEEKIEDGIKAGLLDDMRLAAQALRDVAIPKEATVHDLDRALAVVGKGKQRK
jgi:hypothetical protein